MDSSGSLKLINNAGSILATTTLQTPGANATVINSTQAINLLAGTTGHTVINNSGAIVGDVLFNSGGGNNTLNIGNVGDVTNPNDTTGNANSMITTVQGTAVSNTPFNYASLTGRIDSSVAGGPPISETNLLSFVRVSAICCMSAASAMSTASSCRLLAASMSMSTITASIPGPAHRRLGQCS